MQKRHTNKLLYFEEQVETTRRHVIPFIEAIRPVNGGMKVLEIGCGEAGNLVPFLEKGCHCMGIDLSESKIASAKTFFANRPENDQLRLIVKDIYDASGEMEGGFDLILMRDVIEHIHDQDRFMAYIGRFLRPGGLFFLAFPPWYNPFGGHQQICRNKVLSHLPYFHILPKSLYRAILRAGGETRQRTEELIEIKETGISIERFERVIRKTGYRIARRQHYLINPNYEVKFGLKPRRQSRPVAALPFFRNFLTTTSYYLLNKAGKP